MTNVVRPAPAAICCNIVLPTLVKVAVCAKRYVRLKPLVVRLKLYTKLIWSNVSSVVLALASVRSNQSLKPKIADLLVIF
jgi:hypothetical protein